MQRISRQYVFFLFLATVTLAGLFYLPYHSVRQKNIAVFHTEKSIHAAQSIEDIETFYNSYTKVLRYFASLPSVQVLDESGKSLMKNFYSIHFQDIVAIWRFDAVSGLDYSYPQGILDDSLQLASALSLAKHLDPGDIFVSDLIKRPSGEFVVLRCPIFHGDSPVGSISLLISNAEVTKRFMSTIRMGKSDYPLLLNQSGEILYSPDQSHVGQNFSAVVRKDTAVENLFSKLWQGENGLMLFPAGLFASEEERTSQYGVYMPVRLPGGKHWSILLVSPAAEVLARMSSFQIQWLLVTAVSVVSIIILGFFLRKTVIQSQEEKQQRQFEEKLLFLLNEVPMGVILSDEKARITYANRAALNLLESELPQVVDHSVYDFIQRNDKLQMREFFKEMIQGSSLELPPVQVLTAKKNERDVVLTVTPLTMSGKTSYIVIARDVSEKREAEEKMHRLVMAIEQVDESVIIATTDDRVEYVNSAFCSLSGFENEECIGKTARSLWGGQHGKIFYDEVETVLGRGEVWQGKVTNKRKDGSTFLTATSISPVRDSLMRTTHYVSVKHDITHEVEFEDRLRQAQKMEAIGTLAGGIAHDFNNILGGILGFTDMALLQTVKGSDLHDNLEHIRIGAKRAADLVEQILTFSRQSAVEKVSVKVAPLIKESLKLLRATLPSTIEIEQRITARGVKVYAAPVQIQQIIMNLCTNGFYAMRDHGGKLIITLDNLPLSACSCLYTGEEGECLCLSVTDTGTGIQAENLKNIFDPFFTTKAPGEGSGMGLSVVHGLVEELGGDIKVESEPDVGSTFYIYLPLSEQDDKQEQVFNKKNLQVGEEHILVVDDEKEILETSKMMLEYLGYKVTTTGNPAEVLSMIRDQENIIDLVITDQTMPKITGLELTKKSLAFRPNLPFIICTGYSDKVNYDIAREAGACQLLMKPVDLHKLATAVRSALKENKNE